MAHSGHDKTAAKMVHPVFAGDERYGGVRIALYNFRLYKTGIINCSIRLDSNHCKRKRRDQDYFF